MNFCFELFSHTKGDYSLSLSLYIYIYIYIYILSFGGFLIQSCISILSWSNLVVFLSCYFFLWLLDVTLFYCKYIIQWYNVILLYSMIRIIWCLQFYLLFWIFFSSLFYSMNLLFSLPFSPKKVIMLSLSLSLSLSVFNSFLQLYFRLMIFYGF